MNVRYTVKRLALVALVMLAGMTPRALLACAVCYGASDAAQTRGMNFGMITMLGVTGVVLGSFGGMIFCFARRARRHDTELTP
jgi:heme/copper-type cytochrome/quinol oxidase subunit 2